MNGRDIIKQASKRISWIDVAKGFGIFFIVWGHVLRTGHFRVYLYAFNVTLFFFLLGYTFKYNCSLKDYVKLRFRRTMIPYYIWAVISIVIFLIMGRFIVFDTSEASMSLWKNLIGMVYANSRTAYMKWNQPLWFIPCMNVTLIMVWIIETIQKRIASIGINLYRCLVCLIFMAIGIFMQVFVDVKFPFQLESAVLMVAFVELGLLFRSNKLIEKLSEVKYSMMIAVALFFVGIITVYINGTAEVRTCNYGKYPLLFCVSAVALTLFIATVSCEIQSNYILETMGRISFPILLMHKFPILFFQSVFPVTKGLLARPDTVAGFLCSFIVAWTTIAMCWIGTNVMKRIMPVAIGK